MLLETLRMLTDPLLCPGCALDMLLHTLVQRSLCAA